MSIIKGIYKHMKTGNLYKIIGNGRLVTNPNEEVVVYKQLYKSNLKGTDIELPKYSIWVRSLEDFTGYMEDGKTRKFRKM